MCLYRGALGGHSHLAPSASSSSSGALFFALLGVSCVCVEHSKFLLGVWHLGGCFSVLCVVWARLCLCTGNTTRVEGSLFLCVF